MMMMIISKTIVYLLILVTNFWNVKAATCNYGTVSNSNGNSCDDCGTAVVQPNVKIVGGIQALSKSWPSQALVIQSYRVSYGGYTYSGDYQCGGTLINPTTILTAAHCINKDVTLSNGATVTITPNSVYPTQASMFSVYLGINDKTFLQTGQSIPSPGVMKSVSNVIVHPSYNPSTEQNDIALLILSTPVTYSDSIRPACLPSSVNYNFPAAGSSVYASGWGTLSEGATSTPNVLYNVKLTTYSGNVYCAQVFSGTVKNWNAQICAGNYSGGQDTCQGDSGGPLMVIDNTFSAPRQVVSGITSYGYGCARAGYPGIYTRVSYYLDWIYSYWGINTTAVTATTTLTTTTTKPSITTATINPTTTTSTTRLSNTNIRSGSVMLILIMLIQFFF